jgi:hypothetical protein
VLTDRCFREAHKSNKVIWNIGRAMSSLYRDRGIDIEFCCVGSSRVKKIPAIRQTILRLND